MLQAFLLLLYNKSDLIILHVNYSMPKILPIIKCLKTEKKHMHEPKREIVIAWCIMQKKVSAIEIYQNVLLLSGAVI